MDKITEYKGAKVTVVKEAKRTGENMQTPTLRKVYKITNIPRYDNTKLKSKTEKEQSVEDESDKNSIEDNDKIEEILGQANEFLDKMDSSETKPQKPNKRTEKKDKKDAAELNEAKLQKTPSNICIGGESFQYKVAILHALHPKEILSLAQIHQIRLLLLKELDKAEERCVHLNFLASTVGEGWFTLTCHNVETRDWLMSRVKKIQPYLDSNIKIIPVNDRYMSIVYLPAEDAMPQDTFLSRLAKQNLGLSTDDWRVLSIYEIENGRQCITLSIDEISKEIIQSQNGKLFLNFSQIEVFIEKAIQFSGAQKNGFEQASLKDLSINDGFTGATALQQQLRQVKSEEKISSHFDSYTLFNDGKAVDLDSILSSTDATEISEANKTRTKNKTTVKSSSIGHGTSIYPTKMLTSLKTPFGDIGKSKKTTRKYGHKDGK